MTGDADVDLAQARVLCDALRDQVRVMTAALVKLEPAGHGPTGGALAVRREAAKLRGDISRAQFLLKRLHRRFPDIEHGVTA